MLQMWGPNPGDDMPEDDNPFEEFHGGVDDVTAESERLDVDNFDGPEEDDDGYPDDGECPECGMPWCDLCNACHFCGENEEA